MMLGLDGAVSAGFGAYLSLNSKPLISIPGDPVQLFVGHSYLSCLRKLAHQDYEHGDSVNYLVFGVFRRRRRRKSWLR